VFHGLSLLDGGQLVVRYEDVVRNPRSELTRVAGFLGDELDPQTLGFVEPGAVVLASDHTAVGNDMRFRVGRVPLRVDDQWRRDLPARHRRTVTALTWPLLKRYGYLDDAL
jgi:hypothetical protein